MKQPEWDDEEEDTTRPGPKPERLNTDLTPEELARRVLKAGKPKPGEIVDDEEEEDA